MAKLHDQPYVLSSFLTGFSELIAARGGRLGDICAKAGLAPRELAGPHRLLHFDRFIALLEASAGALRSPDFALQLATTQDLRQIGPITPMLKEGQPMGEALETITRQLSLLVGGIRIETETQTHVVSLRFRVTLPELVHRKQFQDYLLASTVNVIRQLTEGRYPLRGAFFTRTAAASEDLNGYDRYFHSPIAFGTDELRLTFDRRILESRVRVTATDLPLPLGDGADLQQRITDVLAAAMPSAVIDLESIATSLGCSGRTLRRQLAARDLSYASLRDTLRFAMANEYLQSTRYSIADIATLLGYRHQSAFTRSYLRWSGVTPSTYRESLRPPAPHTA